MFHQRLDVDDYGKSGPLLLVEDFIGDEQFYYIPGDDVLLDAPFGSTLQKLAKQVKVGSSGLVAQLVTRLTWNVTEYSMLLDGWAACP